MKKIFTIIAIMICVSVITPLSAQTITVSGVEMKYDENKIPVASIQQTSAATSKKNSKHILIYLGKHSDVRIEGASFVNPDIHEGDNLVKKINRLNDENGDVYLLSYDEKKAKEIAFILSNSKKSKNVKVYVVKGGVEAWKKR